MVTFGYAFGDMLDVCYLLRRVMSFHKDSKDGKFVARIDEHCHYRAPDANILGQLDGRMKSLVCTGERIPGCWRHDGYFSLMLVLVDPRVFPCEEEEV